MFDTSDEYVFKKKTFWKFVFRLFDSLTFSRGPSFVLRFNRLVRYRIARHISSGIEKGASISKGARIVNGVCIKYHGNAGVNCILQWGVHIGTNVMMGENCAIFTSSHLRSEDGKRFIHGYTSPKPVYIGDDTWIGHNVIILPGVHIGKGCTIGGGAVVTKDVPDYCLAAGNPAVVKKKYAE